MITQNVFSQIYIGYHSEHIKIILFVWPCYGLVQVNSHIWQSTSLRDWRWKAAVTLGWMGATFSGSGSWPPRGTTSATRPMRTIYMMREIYTNSCIVTRFYFFCKSIFNPKCVLIITSYFFLWNFIVWRQAHSYWRWDKRWDKSKEIVELPIFM